MTRRGDFPALLIRALTLGQPISPDDALLLRTLSSGSAADLVRREGAASWLYSRLRSASPGNAPDTALPHAGESFVALVRAEAMRDTATALRVESAAAEALAVLHAAAIDVVLLKGVAYRAAARSYPDAAARSTIDVDLLVEPSAADHAWQTLRTAGFEPTPTPAVPPPPGHHHLPGLWSAQRVSIELHTSTSPARRPQDAWTRLRGSAESRDWNGTPVLVPCATELLWHAVEHSCTHGADGFTLRQFLPGAAVLSVAGAVDVDMDQIERRVWTERLRETDSACEVSAQAVAQWLSIAGVLGGVEQTPSTWGAGAPLLWRLLTWRLLTWRWLSLARLSERSRLYPHLWEQGTRAELALASVYTTAHPSVRYRMQHRTLATFARAAHTVVRPFIGTGPRRTGETSW